MYVRRSSNSTLILRLSYFNWMSVIDSPVICVPRPMPFTHLFFVGFMDGFVENTAHYAACWDLLMMYVRLKHLSILSPFNCSSLWVVV